VADGAKPLRADAARNRARVLEVAYQTFAEEGLSVPIDEIARRAGVGAGTLYRHFPTKDALYQAIVVERLRSLTERAGELSATMTAGGALHGFLTMMVNEASRDRGLVEAMAGADFDLSAAAPDVEQRFLDVLDGMLVRAQNAGEVRTDVDIWDVKTVMVGCLAMRRYSDDPQRAERVLTVVWDGLTAATPHGPG
jgi:AcrR family transcriptional regulator